ncbi:short-chain dehydrogenase reductase sdr [Colletotrichum plurivorum]|uniref:Short-chain dehydrogenase reductase sdr n=1 Tax=Colletotrichum plurivorum TaxID=2175906 RepID=A0A8H6JHP9_9PEZI|nr:short-chain dehydrogenase reductase sdr [Colletotrichum plurivorum]
MHSVTASTQSVDDYQASNVFDLLSLQARVIVITGGAKGIGLALGFAVAEAGASVAIIDAAPEPDEAFSKLQKLGTKVGYHRSDVTDYPSLKATFASIVRDFERINGLVTAAGIVSDQPMLQRDPASVKRCLEINSLGTYYSIRLAVEQMVKQPPRSSADASVGSIVTIASIAAQQASKGQYTSDYCMSKGAVLSLTKQLGVELAEHDLKGATVFLLSDASSYMTSAEMLITGGMHAGRI